MGNGLRDTVYVATVADSTPVVVFHRVCKDVRDCAAVLKLSHTSTKPPKDTRISEHSLRKTSRNSMFMHGSSHILLHIRVGHTIYPDTE
jgi:hypothetical protein